MGISAPNGSRRPGQALQRRTKEGFLHVALTKEVGVQGRTRIGLYTHEHESHKIQRKKFGKLLNCEKREVNLCDLGASAYE